MFGIWGKNTKPEMLVRRALFAAGYRLRTHQRDLPGVPYMALSSNKVAIFAHGWFWHMHAGCENATLPLTRPAFWPGKLEKNVRRDRRAVEALRAEGWRVLIV
jgi:DNA mismatch endonuclease, patch repair protein